MRASDFTPYRKRGLAPVPEHFAVRDGTIVGFPLENDRVPDRCIWCNGSAESYRKLVELDDGRWFEVPLCPHHRRQHGLGQPLVRLGMIAAGLALPAGLLWVWLLPAALVLSLVLMATGSVIRDRLRRGLVRDGMAWIRTCRSFASSIPTRATKELAG